MKKILFTLILFFFISNLIAQTAACDNNLWKHVYNPNRFTIWKKCVTVTGVIINRKKEIDGDYHIQLKLDSGQPGFLNQRNMSNQNGCLVLEIICYNKVTQADAIQPCKNCSQNISIPNNRDHVRVTGTFVKDLEANHGWNEIHPVSVIEVL